MFATYTDISARRVKGEHSEVKAHFSTVVFHLDSAPSSGIADRPSMVFQ